MKHGENRTDRAGCYTNLFSLRNKAFTAGNAEHRLPNSKPWRWEIRATTNDDGSLTLEPLGMALLWLWGCGRNRKRERIEL